MLNLDTHVLVFALTGGLNAEERRALGSDRWGISAIVLWEIAKLAQLGRIDFDLEHRRLVRALATVHVWPLSREVAMTSTRLDVRTDMADELIAATSIVHDAPLVTRDRALRRSKLIPLA